MTLRLDGISAGYGPVQVLFDLSLEARPGEVLCLLGRNGAGKTTTLKAIMGLLPLMSGRVLLGAAELSAMPAHEVPKHGIGYIPQGRRLFTELTVAENIEVGLLARGRGAETREKVLTMFPRLRERLSQRAETLSGGEQQMLATARALCLEPEVLLLDEPTEGLQPSMISLIRDTVDVMRDAGVAIILVEQRIEAVLNLADRVAFIENGHGREVVDVEVLRRDKALLQKYVGI
ncbi:ABC transporter ATP-binding protein [Ponticoccus sp. SC2-23]|uniref:ABC transporter ATP-binding protein n=1 Tax=Alexandriicola marinus TaxID=2081710 RepID=UPI000FDA09F2|nr:ABC transporter ATP-binding protein [Alexandriicola marinus]MBM1222322.1 ABC transporter ATP-binding protein [Ponticoccus sp. SC6-9]MBM1224435.1 ABC transporter ATP-binding protein [Ponticoccus sp. SC6-15]MBM1229785.1 ABC transporter ATP-binding protein [Ponticoccus sp. SC6-38]MBM1233401.1 ABC transporter ATP-binding protein [Ponticoccus sp. SC6-45]MBM1236649.1 ABC transporter ATP-binding protein [Ponticoccus sp. SC6-49]MBM1244693.1 ABC transporter ATP-binding protein [Ponticoccus sp. SC2-